MRKCESNRRTQTEHVAYCGREEGHRGPCSFADGNGMHFWLDAYEIANLREMLKAIDDAPGSHPLGVFENGDWFHQVKSKLSDGFILPHNLPNRKAHELMEDFERKSVSFTGKSHEA